MPTGAQDSGDAMVLRALERVEAMFSALNDKFDALPDRFLPRMEFAAVKAATDAVTQETTNRLAALEAGRTADRDYLTSALDKVEDRRRADRNTALVCLLSMTGLMLTVLSLVITHWK